MSGYQRFIAYVYEYHKGKKADNCGFLKVEIKNSACRLEIHLHCPGLPPEVEAKTYGFFRKDGLMNGILLGSCQTRPDMIECTIECNASNLNDTGISFEHIGGIVILTQIGSFLGTEWDDQPIRPDNFQEISIKRENPIPMTAPEKQPITQPQKPAAEYETTVEADTSMQPDSPSETEPSIDNNTPPEAEPYMDCCTAPEVEPSIDNSTPPEAEPYMDCCTLPEAESPVNCNTQSETESPVNCNAGLEPEITTSFDAPSEPESSMKCDTGSQPETFPERKKAPSYVEAASAAPARQPYSFPGKPFMPFDDVDFLHCWKIHPNDLMRCAPSIRSMKNNRFLQYGFYNFGHLLLAIRPGGKYILGVPGGYDQQERFMANMFGFPYFKESRMIQLPRNRGGYWYRSIDAPNFH